MCTGAVSCVYIDTVPCVCLYRHSVVCCNGTVPFVCVHHSAVPMMSCFTPLLRTPFFAQQLSAVNHLMTQCHVCVYSTVPFQRRVGSCCCYGRRSLPSNSVQWLICHRVSSQALLCHHQWSALLHISKSSCCCCCCCCHDEPVGRCLYLLSLSWWIALCACRGTPGAILELSWPLQHLKCQLVVPVSLLRAVFSPQWT